MTFTDWNKKGISLTRHSCSIYCTLLSLHKICLPLLSGRCFSPEWHRHSSTGNPEETAGGDLPFPPLWLWQARCQSHWASWLCHAAVSGNNGWQSAAFYTDKCHPQRDNYVNRRSEFESFRVWAWDRVENCSLQVMLQEHVCQCVCVHVSVSLSERISFHTELTASVTSVQHANLDCDSW